MRGLRLLGLLTVLVLHEANPFLIPDIAYVFPKLSGVIIRHRARKVLSIVGYELKKKYINSK